MTKIAFTNYSELSDIMYFTQETAEVVGVRPGDYRAHNGMYEWFGNFDLLSDIIY